MAPVVINPSGEHKYTLFFLHGLGDTGHGWSESFREIRPQNWKMIFPHAPTQRVTLNAGMQMPSWFDILTLSDSGAEDEAGIHKASEEVKNWIDAEINQTGLSSDRIFLGGFSQGGALAMYTALKYPKKLGGIVALSCWLPLRSEFPQALSEQNKNIRIFHGHGTSDFIVPFRWGEASKLYLQNIGVTQYTFKSYAGMQHSSCSEEMSDVADFLESAGK